MIQSILWRDHLTSCLHALRGNDRNSDHLQDRYNNLDKECIGFDHKFTVSGGSGEVVEFWVCSER